MNNQNALPFLVTHWLQGYGEDQDETNNPQVQRIRSLASDLAESFAQLGAFGTRSSSTNSLIHNDNNTYQGVSQLWPSVPVSRLENIVTASVQASEAARFEGYKQQESELQRCTTISSPAPTKRPLVRTNQALDQPVYINVTGGGWTEKEQQAIAASKKALALRRQVLDEQREIRGLQRSLRIQEKAKLELNLILDDNERHFKLLDINRVVSHVQGRLPSLVAKHEKSKQEFENLSLIGLKLFKEIQHTVKMFADPLYRKKESMTRKLLRRQMRGPFSKINARTIVSSRVQRHLSHSITINCHSVYPVFCLRFDKSGRYFVTGADDHLAKVFFLGGCSYNKNGGSKFTYGANGSRGAVLVCTLRGHTGVIADIDISSDNMLLATCSEDGDCRIWALSNGAPVAILRGHSGGANMVSFSKIEPYRLTTTSEDGLARVWDVREAAIKRCPGISGVRRDYLRFDNENAEDNSAGNQISRVEESSILRSPESLPPIPLGGSNTRVPPIPGAAVNAQGGVIDIEAEIDVVDEGVVLLGKYRHGEPPQELLNQPNTRSSQKTVNVICLARCPLGGHFTTGSDDGVARIWPEIEDTDLFETDSSHKSNHFSKTSRDYSQRRSSRRSDVFESQTPLAMLNGHLNAISDVEYSRAGDRLLTASLADGIVRVWKWSEEKIDKSNPARPTGKIIGLTNIMIRLTAPNAIPNQRQRGGRANRTRNEVSLVPQCNSVAWSLDDSKVITSQSNLLKPNSTDIIPGSQLFKIWNSYNGDCLACFSGHDVSIPVIVVHPSVSHLFASGSSEGHIDLWNMNTGNSEFSYENTLTYGAMDQNHYGKSVGYLDGSFSPDGLSLVMTDENGRVTVINSLDDEESKKELPLWMREQYFADDYYEIVHDTHGYAIDVRSERPPHLSPRAVRVNFAGSSALDQNTELSFRISGPLPTNPEDCIVQRNKLRKNAYEVRRANGLLHQNMIKSLIPSKSTISSPITFARSPSKLPKTSSSPSRSARNNVGSNSASRQGGRALSSNYRYLDYAPSSDDDGGGGDDDDEEEFSLGPSTRRNANRESDFEDEVELVDSDEEDVGSDSDASDERVTRARGRTPRGFRTQRRNRSGANTGINRRTRAVPESDEDVDVDDMWYFTDNKAPKSDNKIYSEFQNDFDDGHIWYLPRRLDGTKVNRVWLQRDTSLESYRGMIAYAPQVGDSVVYIPRAHYETIRAYPSASAVNPPWRSFPRNSVWPFVRCVVKDIRYRFPIQTHFEEEETSRMRNVSVVAVLTVEITGIPNLGRQSEYAWTGLEFIEPANNAHNRHSFVLKLFLNEEPEFLIPELLFMWRCKSIDDKVRSRNNNPVGVDLLSLFASEQGTSQNSLDPDYEELPCRLRSIERINVGAGTRSSRSNRGGSFEDNNPHFIASGYECLKVTYGDDLNTEYGMSFWEVNVPNKMSSLQLPKFTQETKDQLLKALAELHDMEGITHWFGQPVNCDIYRDYLQMIEVPMDLSKISCRLENDYYRSKLSVLADIKLIKANCLKYNEASADIVQGSIQMYERFQVLLDGIIETFEVESFDAANTGNRSTRRRTSVLEAINLVANNERTSTRTQIRRNGLDSLPISQGNDDLDDSFNVRAQNNARVSRRTNRSNRRATPTGINGGSNVSSTSRRVSRRGPTYDVEESLPTRVQTSRSSRSTRSNAVLQEEEEVNEEPVESSESDTPNLDQRRSNRSRNQVQDSLASESDPNEFLSDSDEQSEDEIVLSKRSSRSKVSMKPKKTVNESEERGSSYYSGGSDVDDHELESEEEEVQTRSRSKREAVKSKRTTTMSSFNANYSLPSDDSDESSALPVRTRRVSKGKAKTRKSKDNNSLVGSPQRKAKKRVSYHDISHSDIDLEDESDDYQKPAKKRKRPDKIKRMASSPAKKSGKRSKSSYPEIPPWPRLSNRQARKVAERLMTIIHEKDYDQVFHYPVDLSIVPHYTDVIEEPMDFMTITASIPEFTSIDELRELLILVFKNCCKFNGKGDYWDYAVELWESLPEYFKEACRLEGVKIKGFDED